MIPLYNGFYLFPLSRAVNSNSLIFDPSEFKIDLYPLNSDSLIFKSVRIREFIKDNFENKS